jgi:predicted Fe-S protein YdhL (DUF1289 family)
MSKNPAVLRAAPVSPCIKQCSLDAHGYCAGCYRTIDEIVRWCSMSPEEQWAVLRRVAGGRPAERGR